MHILACNAGSTSLKIKLYRMPERECLAEFRTERIGEGVPGKVLLCCGENRETFEECTDNYAAGIERFKQLLRNALPDFDFSAIDAVCFKTVLAKGFYGVHELDKEVLSALRDALPMAPVHNKAYLEAIAAFEAALPDSRRVGVFETAFHRSIPIERRLYALPYEWYERYGLQRLGFHGASHSSVARQTAALANGGFRLVNCHLGGSSSVCAIKDGRSMDISFGLSPQSGLPHAVRAGDVDPYTREYLSLCGLTAEEIEAGFSRRGGLAGISGTGGDLRDIERAAAEGSQRARLAIDVLVTAIVRYVGMYWAELGGLDYLTFTGGIGENSESVRREVCLRLRHAGIELDAAANSAPGKDGLISAPLSKVRVYIMRTDEEREIAEAGYDLVSG